MFAKQADVSVRSSASAQLRVIAEQIRFLQEQAKKVGKWLFCLSEVTESDV